MTLRAIAQGAGGGGSVTNVTASSPLASSGGATPNITALIPFVLASPSSAAAYFEANQNTPSVMRVGVENGTGGGTIFTGSATDAAVFGTTSNSPVQIFQNNTLRIQVPSSQGSSGNFLQTNGAGVTSWAVPASAAPSYPVTVGGTVTSGGIPYFSSTTVESSSALLAQYGVVVGGGAGAAPATSGNLTFGSGTAGLTNLLKVGNFTAASPYVSNSAAQFVAGSAGVGYRISVEDFGTGSNLMAWSGGTAVMRLDWTGLDCSSGMRIGFNSTSDAGSSIDNTISRGGANQIVFATTELLGGAAVSRAEINKKVTGIADNAATAVLTVTIPNGAHSAGGKIILKGAAGAGGAIGADEFSAAIEYDWVVTRTAGVNAVATLSTALLTAITASVAGGATPTISAALSAIAGAVGATNTFTVNVTIHAVTGSSTNHTCFAYATLLNDNTSGVTQA